MILLGCFILLWLMMIISCCQRESFLNDIPTVDVLTTNPLQHNLWIDRPFRMRMISYAPWDSTFKLLHNSAALREITPTQRVAYIADPYDVRRDLQGYRVLGQGPMGYFVCILSPDTALQECPFDLRGKKIGIFDRSDYLFTRAVLQAYRVPSDTTEIVALPLPEWKRIDVLLQEKEIDMIFAYVIPRSQFHRLLQVQNISLVGFRPFQSDRIRAFLPDLTFVPTALNALYMDVPGVRLRVPAKDQDTICPRMRLSVIEVMPVRESFIVSRLRLNPETNDISFRCYGDDRIENRALCNSPYDVIGMPKRIPTIWDQPCIRNEDCPYYQANRNYSNTRGGCLRGGVCEMPVGVKRIGFRKYDHKGQYAPFCYGCEDPQDPQCCEKQEDPDYVFPNDTAERERAKKETTISIVE